VGTESSQNTFDGAAIGERFRIRCDAGSDNRFRLKADTVCVTLGQRVLRQGVAEMWDSVSIHANEDADGNLTVEVLVFNPDWDEPLRIARIQSRPHDKSCLTPLGCSLDHAGIFDGGIRTLR
jgi:hypothetical protein